MPSSERLVGLKLRKGATAVASVAATLAANGVLHETGNMPTTEVCIPTVTREYKEHTYPVNKPYARKFELSDTVDDVTNAVDTAVIVAETHQFIASGYKGVTLEEAGKASDDDDTKGPDGKRTGGFGVEQAQGRNKLLAQSRAVTYNQEKLRPALDRAGLANIPTLYGEHKEILLTPAQIDELTKQSLKHGLASNVLQDRYDGILKGEVPADTVKMLDTMFGDNRGVDVTIKGYKDVVTDTCEEKPVPVPVALPVFEPVVLADFAPTTGPEKVAHFTPLEKQMAPQWVAKKPIKMKEPHPQGQGPSQIDSHISRTHGGDRGIARNKRVKGSKRGN